LEDFGSPMNKRIPMIMKDDHVPWLAASQRGRFGVVNALMGD
jgi:hypothetical protein